MIEKATPRRIVTCLITLIFALCLANAGALAQAIKASDADELQRLVDQARGQGAKIVVIEAPAAAAAQIGASESALSASAMEDRAMEARARFGEIAREAAMFPERAGVAIRGYDANLSSAWLIWTVVSTLIFLVIGYGATILVSRWAREHFRYMFNPEPADRIEKLSYLVSRTIMESIGIAVMVIVALLLTVIFDEGHEHVRATQVIIMISVASVLFWSAFFRALFAPDAPSHRMLNLSDADAVGLHRSLFGVLAFIALVLGMCIWMEALNLDVNAHLLSLIGATFWSAVALSGFAIRYRRAIAGVILGDTPAELQSLPAKLLARTWHVLATLYFLAAWAVMATRLVLDLPNALGLVTGPIVILLGAIASYGIALLLIEWMFRRRAPKGAEDSAAEVAEAEEAKADSDEIRIQVTHDHPVRTFKDLAERAAGLMITVFAVWSVFDVWGVDLAESGGVFHAVWEVALVGFLAYLGFAAVNIAIERKIAEEGGYSISEHGDEGAAGGASRLVTLLPLLRNFIFIVIISIAAMIALSELGVDIAPLFAGAGVVGLAVGFGAQALIKDIFSGAFFLVDDAFRLGEYIDIGDVKGTVEKISIRSMQLRHHKGPLNTIPFGEIRFLTNYSRDWVMMKLPLRVTYDTDVEKVRKLIKKLGQELLEHPEVGGQFLEPLKSQGVYQMEDSAMIIRVKFMTKPGDQFVIRKMVYSRIREMFAEEGIKFAHKEVTVRVAESSNGEPLSKEVKEAAAGAAREVIDAEQAPAPAGGR